MGRPPALPDRARALVLELLAYAARVNGPLTPPEAAALEGAARGLGAPGRASWPAAAPHEGGRLLPPPLDELSALERRIAFGAAAWMLCVDGAGSFVERAFLEFVAEEAGLGPDEVRALAAAAERARQGGGPRTPLAVEFELLVLEVFYLYALGSAKPCPSPLRSDLLPPARAPEAAEATSTGKASARAPDPAGATSTGKASARAPDQAGATSTGKAAARASDPAGATSAGEAPGLRRAS
ncbi:MAG TPA: hypothetical protein VFS00_31310 [Polyangiaceae bacterium]|nr:hypothetical protein [Polyangiaceae bacterium]